MEIPQESQDLLEETLNWEADQVEWPSSGEGKQNAEVTKGKINRLRSFNFFSFSLWRATQASETNNNWKGKTKKKRSYKGEREEKKNSKFTRLVLLFCLFIYFYVYFAFVLFAFCFWRFPISVKCWVQWKLLCHCSESAAERPLEFTRLFRNRPESLKNQWNAPLIAPNQLPTVLTTATTKSALERPLEYARLSSLLSSFHVYYQAELNHR